MTIDTEEFNDLSDAVKNARSKSERAQGQIDAGLKRLKDEFGCADLAAAKKLLAVMEKDNEKMETSFNSKLTSFKEKYGELLKNV